MADYDPKHQAVIDKWSKKKAQMESNDELARKSMKELIKTAMQNEETHANITRELINARKGGNTSKFREGFGDDNDVVTGFLDDTPWKRD